MDILPLFHDTSDKKSLLTYNKPPDFSKAKDDKELQELKARYEAGPQSIIKICKDHGITQCFGVSRFMNSFYEAFRETKKIGIQFNFGLELIMCNDAKDHTEQSIINNHKIIIFFKNGELGYKSLIKIYTACHANIDNFYYISRFDYKSLKELWNDNLIMVIPPFDSFLHCNTLKFSNIIPDLFVKPTIFKECNSGLPFESLINGAIDNFNIDNKYEVQNVKTVCYYKKEDARAFQVYRCIESRSTMQKPELDFFCSSNFSFENYLELKDKL